MNNIELTKNGKRIRLCGSKSVLEEEKSIIDNLPLTGEEGKDRLIIQQCIDEKKLKSNILYDGNTVYPFNKIVNEYRKLQKDGTLTKMTERMYNFFHNNCGDISHYNIGGYRAYYNNSLKQLEKALIYGNLGEQVVLRTEKAFGQLEFQEAEPVDKEIYYPKKAARDMEAREAFRKDRKIGIVDDETYVLDIMRGRWKDDDARLQRRIFG